MPDKRREALIKDIKDELCEAHGEHCSQSIECDCSSDFCCKRIADFILQRERSLLERIRNIFEQPSDRIIFPITHIDWEIFKIKALAIINEEMGEGE